MKKIFAIFVTISMLACSNNTEKTDFSQSTKQTTEVAQHATPKQAAEAIEEPEVKIIKPRIIRTFFHDSSAYTQGLLYHDGWLYESTGQYGESSIRKINLITGKVSKKKAIAGQYFSEGLSYFNGKMYMLTWRERTCFVIDPSTFEITDEKSYYTEGWGLTAIGNELVMSDGSQFLRFLDPESFKVNRTLGVYDGLMPLTRLNELEFVDGTIYANIFGENLIALIDPDSGKVTGYIDCSEIQSQVASSAKAEVMNGIAYIPENKSFIVTGKYWPNFFEISIADD